MVTVLPPHKLKITPWFRKVFRCNSTERVIIDNSYLKNKNTYLTLHDLYHLEIANLKRIQIGKYWVSGVHGIDIKLFHEFPITAEYDGLLDEIRVAYHECLTRPSLFRTLKLISWMIWLITQGTNSFAVLIRHQKSLKSFEREAIFNSQQLERFLRSNN